MRIILTPVSITDNFESENFRFPFCTRKTALHCIQRWTMNLNWSDKKLNTIRVDWVVFYGAPLVSKLFVTVMFHFNWCNISYEMFLHIIPLPLLFFTLISFYYRGGTFSTLTSFYYRDGKFSSLISFYYRNGPFSTLISFNYRNGTFCSLISFYYRDGPFSTLISFDYRDVAISPLISFLSVLCCDISFYLVAVM